MEYNTKSFSQNPYQIHEEFGLLLEDLVSNSPNPSRFRSKVPWRVKASDEYLRRSMRFQSNQPNYDEHKIKGWCGLWIRTRLKEFQFPAISLMYHVHVYVCVFLVANGIFVQKDFSIRSEYKDAVQNIYRSEIQSLDFRGSPKESAKIINE